MLKDDGLAILMTVNRKSWMNWLRHVMKVDIDHLDSPVFRHMTIGEFRDLLRPFAAVDLVPERFPVATKVHGGAKALLYNTLFVGGFNALPRRLDARDRVITCWHSAARRHGADGCTVTSKHSRRPFDLLVIGAGIHGACIARLAALAGLRVALVDKDDFGTATSRNSAKLLHGGLRYMQDFDVPRIRESMISQRAWFRFVPHLVRPLRFVIPTYGYTTRSPAAMAAGIVAFHMIAAGRNTGIRPEVRLPRSGVMSRRRLIERYPMLERGDVTGGAYWYDGQMLDAVRVTLECVWDAVRSGRGGRQSPRVRLAAARQRRGRRCRHA